MTDIQALAIFCKIPERGFVKTRLAASVGDQKALEIYLELLKITDQETKPFSSSRHLFLVSALEDSIEKMQSTLQQQDLFIDPKINFAVQQGEDLGLRMFAAFKNLFKNHRSVVLIGCDLPDLTSALISKAFDALQSNDLVIGPSCDGGYYLIGLKKEMPDLFKEISWSSEKVLKQTLERAERLSLKVQLLEKLRDIDTLDDLHLSKLK
ncbi:MAG: TIGR04282 family arsenosugar biosynthesis glycosyltransferase [Flavobacteriaceae bacterium]|nr:TIGR04282 family arsenosugar biosynthesis glycosyltransferase [Flavobacteriaceae bacterium]